MRDTGWATGLAAAVLLGACGACGVAEARDPFQDRNRELSPALPVCRNHTDLRSVEPEDWDVEIARKVACGDDLWPQAVHPGLSPMVRAARVIDCSGSYECRTDVGWVAAALHDDVGLTREQVEASLPDARKNVRKMVGRRYEAASAWLEHERDSWDPGLRQVLWDAPRDALAVEAAWTERTADWTTRIERAATAAQQQAVDGTATEETLAQLEALRREYVTFCNEAGRTDRMCLRDANGWPLNAAILRLAEALDDGATAAVVRALLYDVKRRDTPSRVLRGTIEDARDDVRHRIRVWREAKELGLSDAELTERLGPEPQKSWVYGITPGTRDEADLTGFPNRAHARTRSRPPLTRVEVDGDTATLHYPQRVVENTVGTNCTETDRVTGIDFDSVGNARIRYELDCKGSKTTSRTYGQKPIEVPVSDALHLRPGLDPWVYIDDQGHARVGSVIDPQTRRAVAFGPFQLD